jgi:hypothetical protein
MMCKTVINPSSLTTGSASHSASVQWIPGTLTGVKGPGLDFDNASYPLSMLRISGAVPTNQIFHGVHTEKFTVPFREYIYRGVG